MKEIYNRLLPLCSFVLPWILLYNLKKSCLFFTAVCMFMGLWGRSQTNNYFGTTGVLNGAVWSTNPGGPYTSALNTNGGAIINFGNAATATGASISVAGINATADVTWNNGGTLSTGGIVVPITVAGGSTLNMSQAISTTPGTGFIKSGAGVLAMSIGSTYSGGFTLTDGTIIVGGVNVMGNGALNLNGGIVASGANRNLSGKYPGGVNIGGDVQFGDITGLAGNTANLSFNNDISLGGVNRIFIMGNQGITELGGIISNTGSNGISFTANTNGMGVFDITNPVNTFAGPVNINGGQIRFASDGSFGNPANAIVIDGGQLLNGNSFTIGNTHLIQLGTSAGTGIQVATGTLTIDALIADKTISGGVIKTGPGTLILTNGNTFTGLTTIAVNGGILQLNRPIGNTLPANNSVVIKGGVFQISSNQTLNDLSLISGNLTIDNGVTLTINGTFDYYQQGTIVLNGTGRIAYGSAGTLKYSGTIAKIVTANEFPSVNGPDTVTINNAGGVSLPLGRIITGSLVLAAGTFTIGAGGSLDLNGASLNIAGGSMAGNAAADIIVRGTTGGTVILPAAINFRNITVDGTRSLALNGINNLNLYGTLSIASGAVFDNGGESQIIKAGASPSVSISGKFINRDKDNFTGSNGAVPGILPVLQTNCTIEYGLAGDQLVTTRNDYQHINFSGSGTKTLAGGFNPTGTVYITGAATVDASNRSFGDANTNLTMDGGRLKLNGTNNPQPHMSGTYNLTGGVVEFACNSSSGQTIRNRVYQNIEVTGLFVSNSSGNITLNSSGVFTVKSGGIFEMNDNSIMAAGSTNGQSVVVENSGTFLCGNNHGFNGFTSSLLNNSSVHSNITRIVLESGTPGSTINYIRPGDQPITIANGLIYSNLVLSGSGIKTSPSGTLTINGNLSKNTASVFEPGKGLVMFNNSTSPQFISSAVIPTFSFYDITNQNTSGTGLTISSNIGIKNLLTLSANSKLNLNSGDISLLSTDATTSRVAQVPASASIFYPGNGRFIVERYYPALRAWRLITSPLSLENTPATIFSQWQNNGVYSPGIGAFITGPNPNAANGLDDSYFNNYSLKTYRNNAYVNIGNTLTTLSDNTLNAANVGYFMFIRGDRSRSPDNTIVPNTNATTLSSRGKLQIGNQIFPCLTRTIPGTRLFTMVGNPYASPVDFNNITRNNLVKRFVAWDPKLNTVGGFVTVDDYDDDGVYSITASPGGQDLNIQSSQAFFVETDAVVAPAVINFDETSKSAFNNPGIFRPLGKTPSFKSELFLLNTDNSTVLADGNLAEFNEKFNDSVDLQDAMKFTNINETFGLFRNNISLAIERRPSITAGDTLFFNLANITPRKYQLRFEPTNLDPLLSAFLEDRYSGTKMPLSVTSTGTYNFTINDIAASAGASRFRVIFRFNQSVPLAVVYQYIKAFMQDSYVAVEWRVENEIDITKYEVEKSTDGVSFGKENAILANRNNSNYKWLDLNPVNGENYYRICSIDYNGRREYSQIVKLNISKIVPGISVYSNPVVDGIIWLKFKNIAGGRYYAKLINNRGQTILSKMISHAPGISMETVIMNHKPAPGIYQLELTAPGKKITMVKVFVQ